MKFRFYKIERKRDSKLPISILLLLLLFLFSDNMQAQRPGFGIGIVVGDPTGLSFKKFTSGDKAIQGGLAWSFHDRGTGFPFYYSPGGRLYFHLDYLKHYYGKSGVTSLQIPFYVGIGGFTVLRENPVLGVRIPIGVAIHFGALPLDAFFEVIPAMSLFPSTRFGVGLALGGRVYL